MNDHEVRLNVTEWSPMDRLNVSVMEVLWNSIVTRNPWLTVRLIYQSINRYETTRTKIYTKAYSRWLAHPSPRGVYTDMTEGAEIIRAILTILTELRTKGWNITPEWELITYQTQTTNVTNRKDNLTQTMVWKPKRGVEKSENDSTIQKEGKWTETTLPDMSMENEGKHQWTTQPCARHNQKPTWETLVNCTNKNVVQPLPPYGNAEDK